MSIKGRVVRFSRIAFVRVRRGSGGISARRIYLRCVMRRSLAPFTPLENGKRARSDRNHDEYDHHVVEQRRFSLLDDPPAVVNRKGALDCKAQKSSQANKTQQFTSGIAERRRSCHERRKRERRRQDRRHHKCPRRPLFDLLSNKGEMLSRQELLLP